MQIGSSSNAPAGRWKPVKGASGNAYLEIAGETRVPVPVFRNPLSWLQSGGNGVVVLDWDWTRDLLLDHELVAEDLDLGAALEEALEPHIWIREAAA